MAVALITALWVPVLVGSEQIAAADMATIRAQQARTMKIEMDVSDTPVTATLDDNETSKDFVSLLPLTLALEDHNGTEKISNLPKKLSTKGAPDGADPSIGDIAYYAPWGNLAIFYKDFGYSRGLVKLGRIDSGADVFHRRGTLRVTIERIDK